jgi:hypothetical protein
MRRRREGGEQVGEITKDPFGIYGPVAATLRSVAF